MCRAFRIAVIERYAAAVAHVAGEEARCSVQAHARGIGLRRVRKLGEVCIPGCGGLRRQRETFAVHIAEISTSHLLV
jgi:hypothetical protein